MTRLRLARACRRALAVAPAPASDARPRPSNGGVPGTEGSFASRTVPAGPAVLLFTAWEVAEMQDIELFVALAGSPACSSASA